tara:strand:- start:568 stop:969 length:402 start_codon:yes stop_codon:yes gene_type:complete
MLFYDWKKIYETCRGNTSEVLRVLKMLVEKELPVNQYDKIYKYSHIDFRGDSFLLHPDVLLYNAYQYSYKDICIYVAMASARSYAEYAAHGKLSLDLLHLTIDPFIFLDNPRLLYVDSDQLHFLYEEAPMEIH